jgi:hypothetical protein
MTASLFRGSHRGADLVECGRLRLPRNVPPGEAVVVEGRLPLPPGSPLDGWQVGLVNEMRFWLADHGTPFVPVIFSAGDGSPPHPLP